MQSASSVLKAGLNVNLINELILLSNKFKSMNLRNKGSFAAMAFVFLLASGRCECQIQKESISPDIKKQSFIYSVKDTTELGLDMYSISDEKMNGKRPCVVFIFGGAFIGGRRDDSLYNRYFNSLAENNYVVVSISYRLGLRGVKNVSKLNIKPLRKAIEMAVEDTYDATNWILANADKYGIDTSKIILSGSSSGAITALMSDYGKRNSTDSSRKLSPGFEYAGVMAFAGAILSFDWGLKYKTAPPPVLLFHGSADNMVPYNKIRFLNKGFYGSAWIANKFKEKGYPYSIYRAVDLGHEEALLPMIYQIPRILDFINTFIINSNPYQVDLSFKDPNQKPTMLLTPEEVFKKNLNH
jgi:hypothetical protein